MSITEPDKIDMAGIDKITGKIILTITDHIEWDDEDIPERSHCDLVINKLKAYYKYVETEQIAVQFPDYKSRDIIIKVIGKHRPNRFWKIFYSVIDEIFPKFKLHFEFP